MGKPIPIGGKMTPINITRDGCAATITSVYGAHMGAANILSLAHYPMTALLIEYT